MKFKDPDPDDLDILLFDPIIREIESGVIKLDIGSGGKRFERMDMTWTTVDKYMDADVKADMGDLPYEDGIVEEIWSSHALEHIPRVQVIPALTEWFRVLKPGGKCSILVPNFDYAARLWLEKGSHALGYVWGSQEHAGEFHQTGWNMQSLREDLESVGFEVTHIEVLWTQQYTQESIAVKAKKP